jgi:hypothetical protein
MGNSQVTIEKLRSEHREKTLREDMRQHFWDALRSMNGDVLKYLKAGHYVEQDGIRVWRSYYDSVLKSNPCIRISVDKEHVLTVQLHKTPWLGMKEIDVHNTELAFEKRDAITENVLKLFGVPYKDEVHDVLD